MAVSASARPMLGSAKRTSGRQSKAPFAGPRGRAASRADGGDHGGEREPDQRAGEIERQCQADHAHDAGRRVDGVHPRLPHEVAAAVEHAADGREDRVARHGRRRDQEPGEQAVVVQHAGEDRRRDDQQHHPARGRDALDPQRRAPRAVLVGARRDRARQRLRHALRLHQVDDRQQRQHDAVDAVRPGAEEARQDDVEHVPRQHVQPLGRRQRGRTAQARLARHAEVAGAVCRHVVERRHRAPRAVATASGVRSSTEMSIHTDQCSR